MQVIRTLGHGTLTADRFVEVGLAAGIDTLVDVRRYPVSRRHPHFAGEEMAVWLPGRGADYRWLPSLGGRRKPVQGSPNVGLRNEQFRAYADHMATDEFAAGVAELTALVASAAACSVGVMCAESVWWRCHRRLLADHLVLVEQLSVEHVFHDGRLTHHGPTVEARRADGQLIYDGGAKPLPFGPTGST